MKKCTQCGKEYPDDKLVCDVDAWPLVDSTVAQKQAVEAKMGWLERQYAKTNIIVLIGGTLFFAYLIPFGSVVIAVISGIVRACPKRTDFRKVIRKEEGPPKQNASKTLLASAGPLFLRNTRDWTTAPRIFDL
jgi:hypothetical protein